MTTTERAVEMYNSGQRYKAAQLLMRQAGIELDAVGAMRRAAGYRLSRVLHASAAVDRNLATREAEISDEISAAWGDRATRQVNSYFVPDHALRDLSVAGAPGLVGTAVTPGVPNPSNSFLNLCTIVQAAGAGAQQVARFNAMPTVTMLASETATAAEDTPTVSRSLLNPSHATDYIELSRQFAVQSETGARAGGRLLENAIRNKMQQQIIEGSGASNEVEGLATDTANITNTSGTTLAFAAITTTLDVVEKAAGDGALTWVITSAAAKILRARPVTTSGTTPILGSDMKIGGYPVVVIGGTTSATAIFGRWEDLIVYQWSPLEIATNPYAQFQAGIIGIRGWLAFSAAPLVNASFASITGIT